MEGAHPLPLRTFLISDFVLYDATKFLPVLSKLSQDSFIEFFYF